MPKPLLAALLAVFLLFPISAANASPSSVSGRSAVAEPAAPHPVARVMLKPPSWLDTLTAVALAGAVLTLLGHRLARSAGDARTRARPQAGTQGAAPRNLTRFDQAQVEIQTLPHMTPAVGLAETERTATWQATIEPELDRARDDTLFDDDTDVEVSEDAYVETGGRRDDAEAWQREALGRLKTALASHPKALQRKRLLNREEWPLFEKVLDRWAWSQQLRVMVQVNMGEFIRTRKDAPDTDDLYRVFGSKRVDFLVCDWRCRPLLAVEYFGGGHGQGTAELRDVIKAQALMAVGIPLVIVQEAYDPFEVRCSLDAALAQARDVGEVQPVFAMKPIRGERPRRVN
ncbi:DUF2726 domain-containing protein [Caulobacter sp. RHG1]|uniref:DUF2726 domain-containing protein n=1 Tax=Caulobacter sp. (strain RHG1) TaxID=2545762 RepID=UPI00155440B6|nr:DUF2726 domain-containing protein [Caulobacter sp. RHG1]NQE61399.1 hypothetical protein [Caulobacter sp. RHG1]